ncbi:MAG TPA: protein-L-isoaspartate(D-aspartate) O-methyltransferase [Thermodesulfobacteriota bacterium]|nr:protein-L-isoaspartate(D-aspartate) O-methyltransferase [Thermodesulfobacteriota bacterium]
MSAFPAYSAEDPKFIEARKKMVERHLKGRDITDPKVLEVMGRVPRQEFVDPSRRDDAYKDRPLPIAEGQTISQPYIVALMTQVLRIQPGEKVLEVGTGSGYQAAVLAELTDKVYSIEIIESLAKEAAERLKRLGYPNIRVKHGDGYLGWEEEAPFDAIIVTAAAGHIPPALIAQLKEGGRLVMPVGSTRFSQTLTLITKKSGKTGSTDLGAVSFVPLTGEVEKK